MQAFEAQVCHYLGLEEGHAVALSSGTAALFMALWALGAKGKRVAVPVYSCAALRNAALLAGSAAVVPIDISEQAPNLDPTQVTREQADLVVAAHIFGIPSRWDREPAVPVIEDCAQAFGARIDGRCVGLNGAVGVFSFYATKMLTSAGQGGMLVSRERSLVDAVRDYREFDCRPDRQARFNFQMTDVQAAVGRAQLAQIDRFIERRREIRARYASAGLPLWPAALPAGVESCDYRAVLRVANPTALIAGFEAAGVRAIVPIADWELLDDAERFPRAAALARSTVSIPAYPSLSDAEIARIVETASILNLLQ